MNIREMTKEQLSEESMIDIAYAVLIERGRGEHLTLKQLMDEVRKLNGVTVKAMAENLQQFYTDMNIDGRFLSIDDIRWGLREWYPVDTLEEETAPVVRVRKKKKKRKTDLIEDEIDDIEDDEDEEEDEDDLLVDGFDEIDIDEDDEDEDEEDDDSEEDIVEIDADLLDPDDELEIIPEDEDFDDDEEDEDEDLEE